MTVETVNIVAVFTDLVSQDGEPIALTAGQGGADGGDGGYMLLNAGSAHVGADGRGGAAGLFAGTGQGTSRGGYADVAAGTALGTEGDGGTVRLTAGAGAQAGDGNGGNIELYLGTGHGTGANGNLLVSGLPTSDPHIADVLWNNAGVLTISAG